MRLRRHFDALLVERNIINVKDVDEFISDIVRAKRCSKEEQKWLKSAGRKWLINDFPGGAWITSPKQSRRAFLEPWAMKALENGERLFDVSLDNHLREEMHHVIDWLRADGPARLNRVAFQHALDSSHRWTEKLKKQKHMGDDGEVEVVDKLKGGFALVKLHDKKALSREGSLMSHCVGGYDTSRYSGYDGIYSLRDKKNMPHATIEVANKAVVQIQSKGNKAIAPRYREALKQALNTVLMSQVECTTDVMEKHGLVRTSQGTQFTDDISAGSRVSDALYVDGDSFDACIGVHYEKVTTRDGDVKSKAATIDVLKSTDFDKLSLGQSTFVSAFPRNGGDVSITSCTFSGQVTPYNNDSVVMSKCGGNMLEIIQTDRAEVTSCSFEKILFEETTDAVIKGGAAKEEFDAAGCAKLVVGGLDASAIELSTGHCASVSIDAKTRCHHLNIDYSDHLEAMCKCETTYIERTRGIRVLPRCKAVRIRDSFFARRVDAGTTDVMTFEGACMGDSVVVFEKGEIGEIVLDSGKLESINEIVIGKGCKVSKVTGDMADRVRFE